MDRNIKQVIVMIDKFLNDKGESFSLRKGKMMAQASHASIAFAANRIKNNCFALPSEDLIESKFDIILEVNFTPIMLHWLCNGSSTKICVKVESLEEFYKIADRAKEAGLEVHVITDIGKTEFKEPTVTCMAIGPDLAEKIDPITSHLKLL